MFHGVTWKAGGKLIAVLCVVSALLIVDGLRQIPPALTVPRRGRLAPFGENGASQPGGGGGGGAEATPPANVVNSEPAASDIARVPRSPVRPGALTKARFSCGARESFAGVNGVGSFTETSRSAVMSGFPLSSLTALRQASPHLTSKKSGAVARWIRWNATTTIWADGPICSSPPPLTESTQPPSSSSSPSPLAWFDPAEVEAEKGADDHVTASWSRPAAPPAALCNPFSQFPVTAPLVFEPLVEDAWRRQSTRPVNFSQCFASLFDLERRALRRWGTASSPNGGAEGLQDEGNNDRGSRDVPSSTLPSTHWNPAWLLFVGDSHLRELYISFCRAVARHLWRRKQRDAASHVGSPPLWTRLINAAHCDVMRGVPPVGDKRSPPPAVLSAARSSSLEMPSRRARPLTGTFSDRRRSPAVSVVSSYVQMSRSVGENTNRSSFTGERSMNGKQLEAGAALRHPRPLLTFVPNASDSLGASTVTVALRDWAKSVVEDAGPSFSGQATVFLFLSRGAWPLTHLNTAPQEVTRSLVADVDLTVRRLKTALSRQLHTLSISVRLHVVIYPLHAYHSPPRRSNPGAWRGENTTTNRGTADEAEEGDVARRESEFRVWDCSSRERVDTYRDAAYCAAAALNRRPTSALATSAVTVDVRATLFDVWALTQTPHAAANSDGHHYFYHIMDNIGLALGLHVCGLIPPSSNTADSPPSGDTKSRRSVVPYVGSPVLAAPAAGANRRSEGSFIWHWSVQPTASSRQATSTIEEEELILMDATTATTDSRYNASMWQCSCLGRRWFPVAPPPTARQPVPDKPATGVPSNETLAAARVALVPGGGDSNDGDRRCKKVADHFIASHAGQWPAKYAANLTYCLEEC
mgnify:CR=1 FL=1